MIEHQYTPCDLKRRLLSLIGTALEISWRLMAALPIQLEVNGERELYGGSQGWNLVQIYNHLPKRLAPCQKLIP